MVRTVVAAPTVAAIVVDAVVPAAIVVDAMMPTAIVIDAVVPSVVTHLMLALLMVGGIITAATRLGEGR